MFASCLQRFRNVFATKPPQSNGPKPFWLCTITYSSSSHIDAAMVVRCCCFTVSAVSRIYSAAKTSFKDSVTSSSVLPEKEPPGTNHTGNSSVTSYSADVLRGSPPNPNEEKPTGRDDVLGSSPWGTVA